MVNVNHPNKYLIVITGPTAIGKTDLALMLNEDYKTSIISADSRQVYKELSIGTAKPTQEEILKGNIQLVDHTSIHDSYNAGIFERQALEVLDEVFSHSDYCIVCGGTGLYIEALVNGLDTFPTVNKQVLDKLEEDLKVKGLTFLVEELKLKDEDYFRITDINNPRRIIRALSIIRHSGKTFSSFREDNVVQRSFKPIFVILNQERNLLYERINSRVLNMMDLGFLDEVESLFPYRDLKALETVGYKELFAFIDGESSLEESIAEIQKNSRRYAKRQMTWLKRYNQPIVFEPFDVESIKEYIKSETNL